MSETTPEQDPTPDPDPTPESGRYAVYDDTLQQYVGGTHDTRKAANSVKSVLSKSDRHKGHDFTVRAV